ncbi:hypothetical protein EC988_002477 [Linderina pennispora]|nr:hypothetical protein EC988_002477 [Linderina pennispora]
MDYFKSNVQSNIYKLSKYDSLLSLVNLRHVYFYGNSDYSDDYMPSTLLEQGFYRALTRYPVLAGHLQQTDEGQMEIVVDKDNLNMPIYHEFQSDIHFSDISKADFSPSAWPHVKDMCGKYTCPDRDTGTIKLGSFYVARLKQNSGVVFFANFCHSTGDGTSCFEFFNRWAAETHALATDCPAKEVVYCFDRDVITSELPSERTPLDEGTRMAYSRRSALGDWIAWVSPNTRGRAMAYLDSRSPARGHLFRISRRKFDELRSQVLECMPPGARMSSNDLLNAVFYKVHGQARLDAERKQSGWLSWLTGRREESSGEHRLSFTCDLRHRLGISHLNYIGNPLYNAVVSIPIEHAQSPITPHALADVATQVRGSIAKLTPSFIGSYFETIETSGFNIGTFMTNSMRFKLITYVTNAEHARMYHADFGHGVQSFSTINPDVASLNFTVVPSPPSTRDFFVNIMEDPSVMDCILTNKFWTEFTTQMY